MNSHSLNAFFFSLFLLFFNRHRAFQEGNNTVFQLRHLIKILALTEGYVPQLLYVRGVTCILWVLSFSSYTAGKLTAVLLAACMRV